MGADKHDDALVDHSVKRSRIAEVLDSALDAVVTIDSTGVIVDWNDQAVEIFGWSRAEIQGRTLTETIIPEKYARMHNEGLRRFSETGYGPVIGKRIEIEARDREGEHFPVELSITPIRIDKDAAGFTGFIRDLRRLQDRQEKLELSDQRLQLILDGASEGFWDIHLDSERSALSSRCSTMLGYESGYLENRAPPECDLIHPDDTALVRERWRRHLDGDAMLFDVIYRMKSANGSWVHVHDIGEVLVRDDAGTALRVTGTRKDVTQELVIEESLLTSQRLDCMGMVAAGFAHDLNTLLASVAGHAEAASRLEGLPAQAEESMEVIQQAVTRAKVLTENMLTLGRSDYQRFGELDPASVVETTIALVEPRFRKEVEVAFDCRLDPSDRIFVDQNHLQSALVNLFLNALDAIEGAGTIRIVLDKTVEAGEDWMTLSVSDSGAGVAAEDALNIFKPFYTTKKPGDGVGIGLAVVQIFANSVGGTIILDSAEGRGATFTLSLPMNRGTSPSVRSAGGSQAPVSYRVLLVEDHELLRPMLKEAIEGLGHTVVMCAGVEESEALTLEHRQSFDLMVVDVNLEDGDGVDLVRRLEQLDECIHPAIFVTGNPKSLTGKSLRSSQRLLHKPFGMDDLSREIELLMQGSPPRR
ncbi:MAG: PAS domain S-box protein [Planctomycetota bacterium]|nr:PAS domain S-box protein [Planctomycetota bacterium]